MQRKEQYGFFLWPVFGKHMLAGRYHTATPLSLLL